MSTTTDTTTPRPDRSGPAGATGPSNGPASKDPYIRGTDETVLLDLRELRAQEAADKAAREAAALGTPGAELERYHGSHRRDAVLYADGGTAIPLDRVREVCHDLRQPVAAILMLASAAELRPDVPERVRDVLQEIMSQTEEISATVRQFLDDAKQGVDGLGEPVPCNVAGLAAESVERWRATFDGDLALAAAEDPLHVTVDPILFKRALGNVLSNGTRAAGDSGRVQVTVRRFETAEGERAVIEVDDSGPGFGNIPAGHGLGLAVVRRTIEAAGGSVEFAEGPLGGALVRLVLPVTPIRPLSADDELTKTFHGEISLSQLAAELAAGGVHPALAEFEDDDFEDVEDFDDFEGFGGVEAAPPAPLTGGHAFTTRMSAWPEPMAISGTPEQLAIGGPAGPANPFGARAAEQAPAVPPAAAIPAAADNRSYFGLPVRESAESQPARAAADRGYFGLPLKNDNAASQPSGAPAPQQRSDIAAHPVPSGLLSARRTPHAPAELPAAPQSANSAAAAYDAAVRHRAAAAARSATPHNPAASGAAIAYPTHRAAPVAAPQPPMPYSSSAAASSPAVAHPAHPAAPSAAMPSAAQAPTTPAPAEPTASPTPTFDPSDTQPLHIIPTGQDDTALASIQLPSQANLTRPPRIPASALRPVASVQLSLLPGGAF